MDTTRAGGVPKQGAQAPPSGESQEREKISRIMDRHVGIEERRARFLREAEAALRKYSATRQGVGVDDVLDWIDTWGGAGETEAPPCRR